MNEEWARKVSEQLGRLEIGIAAITERLARREYEQDELRQRVTKVESRLSKYAGGLAVLIFTLMLIQPAWAKFLTQLTQR